MMQATGLSATTLRLGQPFVQVPFMPLHQPPSLMLPSPDRRRSLVRLISLAAATGLLAGCASLLGPRDVDISREELLSKLAKSFPVHQQMGGLFDVDARAPKLTMLPADNRVAASIDFTARDRVLGSTYQGTVDLSFGLRYEPSDLTIRLASPRIEQVRMPGLPSSANKALSRIGAWLTEDKMNDYPVHRFKPEDLRKADRMGYRVDNIRVVDTGLRIHLEPRN